MHWGAGFFTFATRMSTAFTSRPRRTTSQRTFAIVSSRYNHEFTGALVENAEQEIENLSKTSTVLLFEVPGAFEIPVVIEELAARGGMDAFIALGVILEGKTQHARLIAEAVTRSLQEISVRHRVPVIHEVLLLASEEQARERCLGDRINRGTEAARVAVSMVQVMSELRASAGMR